MKKQDLLWGVAGLSFAFVLSGCVVRTYPLTKDRVDQDLTGNRGYIEGQVPSGEEKERKTTRVTQVVEIELHSPLKFEKMPKPKVEQTPMVTSEEQVAGNKGYITSSISPTIAEQTMEKYTVQKNDTLQKISQRFYGTSKKWMRIYDVNKDTLKGPNSIRPGQVLNIPVEKPKENLK